MKKPKIITIYGKIVRTWTAWSEVKEREIITQIEVEYMQYDAKTGEIIATGTRDIARQDMDDYSVYDVQAARDGARYTDTVGTVTVRTRDRAALTAARIVYGAHVVRVVHPYSLRSRAARTI